MIENRMSARLKKQLQRLASNPKDLRWSELKAPLQALGFVEQQGDGAAVRFRHKVNTNHTIRLHKPHGRNPPTVLVVYVREVVRSLREWGYMNE